MADDPQMANDSLDAILRQLDQARDPIALRDAIQALPSKLFEEAVPLLERLVLKATQEMELLPSDYYASIDRWRTLRHESLVCIAKIDSPFGHQTLCQLLQKSIDARLRADVLEAMAAEKTQKDLGLLQAFLTDESPEEEITSALFALHGTDLRDAPLVRVVSLLAHEHPYVRQSAMHLLARDGRNEALLQPMLNDSNESVAEVARGLLKQMQEGEQKPSESTKPPRYCCQPKQVVVTWREIRAQQAHYLEEARRRHPMRKTICGALTSEIASLPEGNEFSMALQLVGKYQCKRAVRALVSRFQANPDRDHRMKVLMAIGFIDSCEGHAFMKDLLDTSPDAQLRGDVLEALTFEEENYDAPLLIGYLDPTLSVAEISSALYALTYKALPEHEAAILPLVPPLLSHPEPYVRGMAAGLFSTHAQYRNYVLPLLDDPNERVVTAAQDALKTMDLVEEDP